MTDIITTIHHSLIQHGPDSNRIYLMKLDHRDTATIIEKLDELARTRGYTKIFAKIPESDKRPFEDDGYIQEAVIPRFFHGEKNAAFMAKYVLKSRQRDPNRAAITRILKKASRQSIHNRKSTKKNGILIRECTPKDCGEMSRLYKEVFESYPFPIHDPVYLKETMKSHIRYFCVTKGKKMMALASAEMDRIEKNVEMTDFATRLECRRQGLASRLLELMEEEMKKEGFLTAYTVARALSEGMTLTFAKGGYQFAGTLTNNTNIAGRIESMNVWYKPLR